MEEWTKLQSRATELYLPLVIALAEHTLIWRDRGHVAGIWVSMWAFDISDPTSVSSRPLSAHRRKSRWRERWHVVFVVSAMSSFTEWTGSFRSLILTLMSGPHIYFMLHLLAYFFTKIMQFNCNLLLERRLRCCWNFEDRPILLLFFPLFLQYNPLALMVQATPRLEHTYTQHFRLAICHIYFWNDLRNDQPSNVPYRIKCTR